MRPEAAIELVTFGKVGTIRLISQIFRSRKAVEAIDSLSRGEGMKVLLKPALARVT